LEVSYYIKINLKVMCDSDDNNNVDDFNNNNRNISGGNANVIGSGGNDNVVVIVVLMVAIIFLIFEFSMTLTLQHFLRSYFTLRDSISLNIPVG